MAKTRIVLSGAEFHALQRVVEAAHGLSFGKDWNNGNAAKRHGYRAKLLRALPKARRTINNHAAPESPK